MLLNLLPDRERQEALWNLGGRNERQPIAVVHWQRAEQKAVDDREDRRVGADPERTGHDRHE
jgi:hypothetical protein